MNRKLKSLKQFWILNFVRRIYIASKYYNRKYPQIVQWGFASKEDTNFTYHLTERNLIYLAQTIALIMNEEYIVILKYIKEAQENKELKNHIFLTTYNSKERKFADKEVRFRKRLGWYAFACAMKPKVIIETGVDKGLGSVLLCAALEKNKLEGFDGKYYGTDINTKAGYLFTGNYSEFGEILYGDSIESLSNFEEKIDLFTNNSDHSTEYEYEEYNTIKPLLHEKTIISGDNAHCSDKLS